MFIQTCPYSPIWKVVENPKWRRSQISKLNSNFRKGWKSTKTGASVPGIGRVLAKIFSDAISFFNKILWKHNYYDISEERVLERVITCPKCLRSKPEIPLASPKSRDMWSIKTDSHLQWCTKSLVSNQSYHCHFKGRDRLDSKKKGNTKKQDFMTEGRKGGLIFREPWTVNLFFNCRESWKKEFISRDAWKSNAELCVIRKKSVLIPVNRQFLILIPVNRARHPPPPPPFPTLMTHRIHFLLTGGGYEYLPVTVNIFAELLKLVICCSLYIHLLLCKGEAISLCATLKDFLSTKILLFHPVRQKYVICTPSETSRQIDIIDRYSWTVRLCLKGDLSSSSLPSLPNPVIFVVIIIIIIVVVVIFITSSLPSSLSHHSCAQAQIHTGFHHFTENSQIFHNK